MVRVVVKGATDHFSRMIFVVQTKEPVDQKIM